MRCRRSCLILKLSIREHGVALNCDRPSGDVNGLHCASPNSLFSETGSHANNSGRMSRRFKILSSRPRLHSLP